MVSENRDEACEGETKATIKEGVGVYRCAQVAVRISNVRGRMQYGHISSEGTSRGCVIM